MLRARDYRAKARGALQGNWGLAVGTGLAVQFISVALVYVVRIILAAIGIISFSSVFTMDDLEIYSSGLGIFVYWLLTMASTFIVYALSIGYAYFNLNLVRGDEFRFDDIFARFHKILKIFGLFFMIGLFTALWSLLLVIPGIIAAFRYAMAPYIMAEDPEVGVMEAIRKSKEMMKGYKWKYFCLELSFIGWILLGIITLGIGLLWVGPYMEAAGAAFYLEISGQNVQYEYDLYDE